jgi:hypothetical protein
MPRRGRCRCGQVLVFHRGPQGYKTRCPQCLAVVRLHLKSADKPTPPPNPSPFEDFDPASFAATQFLDLDEKDHRKRGHS